MSKLSKAIRSDLIEKRHKKNGLKITFSSDTVPGEGEHKLLKDLKKNSVIYSPDADLIVLLMSYNYSNLYILRSNDDVLEQKFIYLDLDKYKESLKITEPNLDIQEYIFTTYICGNDFVPSSQIMKIKEGSLDIFSKIRVKYPENKILNFNSIDFNSFKIFVNELKNMEQDLYKNLQRKRFRSTKMDPESNLKELAKFKDLEKWQQDLQKFQHYDFFRQDHPQHTKYNYLFNKIDYYKDDWISQYNSYFFKNCDIKIICEDYIRSLNFCMGYYFSKEQTNKWSWSWSYTHRTAPTFHDLYNYLESIDEIEFNKLSVFDHGQVVDPLAQLLMILPKELLYLVPKEIKDKSPNLNIKKYDVDAVQGLKFIYSEPILPDIPVDECVDIIKNYRLDFKKEYLHGKDFII
jgi:5'-3' exonuclease